MENRVKTQLAQQEDPNVTANGSGAVDVEAGQIAGQHPDAI
jgi:hypothetical protein